MRSPMGHKRHLVILVLAIIIVISMVWGLVALIVPPSRQPAPSAGIALGYLIFSMLCASP